MQVMQSIKVTNEKLDLFGQAGHVVGFDANTKKVSAKMDVDGEVYEFDQTDVQGL